MSIIFEAYHEDGLDVFFTCNQFPVQAEGYVDGFPFYYRARWGEWMFCVPLNRDGDPVEVSVDEIDGFIHEGDYDDTDHLSFDEAKAHIAEASAAWRTNAADRQRDAGEGSE